MPAICFSFTVSVLASLSLALLLRLFFPVRYVAEMCMNRILRFTQRPAGVWHSSVFYQFSGGLGPSSIVVDKMSGYLYVGRYDFALGSAPPAGSVAIIAPDGKLHQEIPISQGPEVTGIAIGGADNPVFYVTEASSGRVLLLPLQ